MEIKESMQVDSPRALKQRLKTKNKGKSCAFYRDYGHDIEYCWDLDKMLHDLASQKKLDKYLKAGP